MIFELTNATETGKTLTKIQAAILKIPLLKQKIDNLPPAPGVYLMKDEKNKIFYIGKAKNLKERLRSYFSGNDPRLFVSFLDRLLKDLDIIITNSDKEALILENELIKEHRPRYNIKLTDDKRYLCLRLNLKDPYPALEIVRRFANDQALYFGPYTSSTSLKNVLHLINRHFKLRTCSNHNFKNRKKPCIQYQIKRCEAPCIYETAQQNYQHNVQNVRKFLSGQAKELLADLKKRMLAKSALKAYEEALHLKKQILAIEEVLEKQQVLSSTLRNRDVLGIYQEENMAAITVLNIREGRLLDTKNFCLDNEQILLSEILSDFTTNYFNNCGDLPQEILLPENISWVDTLEKILKEKAQHEIKISNPKRGEGLKLLEIAKQNAKQAFILKRDALKQREHTLQRLQQVLHLKNFPSTIECFDISHLQGTHTVGSLVQFVNGEPRKEGYRHYKIQTTTNIDDFAAIFEVISRRSQRALTPNENFPLPDLMIIDGGKGQLQAAKSALLEVLKEFPSALKMPDLISLAKARTLTPISTKESTYSLERIFIEGQKNPLILAQNSPELLLLAHARDEAHRFAITFHRRLRHKQTLKPHL